MAQPFTELYRLRTDKLQVLVAVVMVVVVLLLVVLLLVIVL